MSFVALSLLFPFLYYPKSNASSSNYSSRLRTREQIEQSGAYDKPVYRPARTAPRSSAQEKQRLANLMAFGSELEPSAQKKNARPITPPSPPLEVDRFDERERNFSGFGFFFG